MRQGAMLSRRFWTGIWQQLKPTRNSWTTSDALMQKTTICSKSGALTSSAGETPLQRTMLEHQGDDADLMSQNLALPFWQDEHQQLTAVCT